MSKDLDRLQELEKSRSYVTNGVLFVVGVLHSGRESVYVPANGYHGQFSLYEVVGPIDE